MATSITQVDRQIDTLTDEQLRHRIAVAGLCADTMSDDWFPHEPSATATNGRAAYELVAREQCEGCEVKAECLILALRDESRYGVKAHGIFGGLAPWERENLARNQRRRVQAQAVAA